MAQVSRLAGSTGHINLVQIDDSASTTGGGKTGLLYSGVTCYYKRNKGSASVAVTLATITTLGTYTSGGFKEIDATNMPGLYEFHPPDAAVASGSGSVVFYFTAAGAAPSKLFVELTAVDNQDAQRLGLAALPSTGTLAVKPAATLNASDVTGNLPADVQTIKTQSVTAAGAVTFPGSIGTSTYAGADTSGTTTLLGRIGSAITIASGKVAATVAAGDSADAASVKTTVGVAGAGLTAIGDTRLANLDATVSSRSTFAGGAVASVTAAVTVGTNNDKAGYSLTQAFPANFSVLAITPTTGYVTAGTVGDKAGYSGTATNLPSDYQQRGVAVTLPATLPAGSINTAAFAAGATLPRVTLADTVTTYTGNTPQTGDAFARLGAPTGVSIAADIQTRSTYAGGAVASVTGSVGSVTSPVTVNAINGQAPPTNWSIMVVNGSGYVTTSNPATGGSAVTEATIWAYATRTLSDKTGFALTTAYDPAKTAAQAGNAMTLTTGERSAIATAVLTDTTAGDLAAAGSLGHIVTTAPGWYTAPPSVSGLATSSALSALAATVGTAGAGLTGIPYTGPNVAAIQSGLATASQIPASFTAGTFASPGVFATAALANAPTGSGGTFPATAPANWITTAAYAAGTVVPANVIQIAGSAQAAANLSADELATAPTLPAVDGSGRVSLNLAQAGLAPRDLSGVADASLTVGDALVAAIAGAAGKEAVSGTTYTVRTPATGTVIRAFTLDSSTAPTSRT